MGVWRWGMLAIGMGLLPGCFSEPPDAKARLDEVKREGKALADSLDTMEERMLGNQATVKLWAEMKERHGQITEVTCKSNMKHFDAMVNALDKQEQKARSLKRRRSVASVDTALTSGHRPN